jgi:hypothetical protein
MAQPISLLPKRGFLLITLVAGILVTASATAHLSSFGWSDGSGMLVTFQLSGRVTEQSGNPIPATLVEVLSAGTFNVIASTSTDSNGYYNLSVEQGAYDVRITPAPASGFQPATATGQNISSDTSLDFVLVPVATIVTVSGRVTDRAGNGVNVASVSFGAFASPLTDASGFYSRQLETGTYLFFVSNGIAPFIPIDDWRVVVPSISITADTTFDLQLPTSSLSVHVQDAAGNPVSNVKLYAIQQGEASLNLTTSLGQLSATASNVRTNATTDAFGNATMWVFAGADASYTVRATPPDGSVFAPFTVSPLNIDGDRDVIISLQFVHAPPTTTATVSPSPNSQGLYSNPVSLSLSAAAYAGFTVAATYYSVDNGPTQAYGSPFTVSGDGAHMITYWSVDSAGVYEAPKTLSFTIASNSQPVASCKDIVKNVATTCEADALAEEFNNGSVDADGDSLTFGLDQPGPFPIGTTPVTLTVSDNHGGSGVCAATITVVDDGPPIVTAPSPVTVFTGVSGSVCGVTVSDSELGSATATDNCSAEISRFGIPANNLFPVGTTVVTYQASDPSGNSTTATQVVHVVDNTAPTITGPPSITVSTGSGASACGVIVSDATFGAPLADDNCPGVQVVRNGVPSGNVFPVGLTTVTYTATDASGNTGQVNQTVTVIDSTPPMLTLNGANPMTVECHTSFVDPGGNASDNCAGNLTGAIAVAGSVEPNVVGDYALAYSVSDGNGNLSSVQRLVQVRDTIAPTITMNTNQQMPFSPANHQYRTISVVDFVLSASDGCDANVDRSDVYITKITSDEAENGPASGNTPNDIIIAADCRTARLRAERESGGDGRVYIIHFKLRDASGNFTTATAKVTVPRSQNDSNGAVDGGVNYTVTSNCP